MATMETVRLRNGDEVARPLVLTTMITLQALYADPLEVITLYELNEVATRPGHRPFGNTGDKLHALGLLESPGGGMHDAVRSIVLSALHFDGDSYGLTSPVQGGVS
jgi:hypothetical protein